MSIEIIVSEALAEVTNYQEAIRCAGGKLVEQGTIQQAYVDACIEREVDFPTGLLLANNLGVAMPHGNSKLVNKSSISILRLAQPVAFGRMEDNARKVECSLIFNLALESGQQHIEVLRKVMGLFQNNELMETCQTTQIEGVQQLIKEKLAN